jgi:hypothetical protein
MLKRFFISLVVLAVICLGGFIVYNVAYGAGEAAGYDTGYSSGQDAGYTSGKQDGYDEGVQAALGHGYTLRDPTYQEAVSFIEQDRTDENEYVEDIYVCSHFARDVCNSAEGEDIRCAYVQISYPDAGHAIVAFDTVDEGLVYFDAITDERVRPVIGKRYYECVEPKGNYYYEEPSFDDTITDILIIW